jgi:hypothetical protein
MAKINTIGVDLAKNVIQVAVVSPSSTGHLEKPRRPAVPLSKINNA